MSESMPVTGSIFEKYFDQNEHHTFLVTNALNEKNFANVIHGVERNFGFTAHERYIGIVSSRISGDEVSRLHAIAKFTGFLLSVDQVSKRVGSMNIAYADIRVLSQRELAEA